MKKQILAVDVAWPLCVPLSPVSLQNLKEVQVELDIFTNIPGVPAESLDAAHKDEIEVLSFSWRVTHFYGRDLYWNHRVA